MSTGTFIWLYKGIGECRLQQKYPIAADKSADIDGKPATKYI